MPIIKSAKKRARQTATATIRNTRTKRTLRSAFKSFASSLGTKTDTAKAQSEAQKALDIAVKKGLIHKNKAARKKAQLARNAKAAATDKPAKKVVAKKTAAKTTKPAAKKAVAKKTATKKPAAKK